MKVHLICRDSDPNIPTKDQLTGSPREFEQMPRVGDYISGGNNARWCRVELVVWIPRGLIAANSAELYCVWVDPSDVSEPWAPQVPRTPDAWVV